MNVKTISITETITKTNMDNRITLPKPIILRSFAAEMKFKAFNKLPVCANLASAMD